MMIRDEKVIEANRWNSIQIGFLLDYMEKTKAILEVFEPLGVEAAELIDNQITELESVRCDYEMDGIEQ